MQKDKLLKMIIPIDEKDFLDYTEKYIFEIFKLNKKFDVKRNIVVEQGGNFLKPISSTKFYGNKKSYYCLKRSKRQFFLG